MIECMPDVSCVPSTYAEHGAFFGCSEAKRALRWRLSLSIYDALRWRNAVAAFAKRRICSPSSSLI
jgi:hypothetical protein